MSNTMSFSSPYVILSVLGLYFFMLLAVGYITGRKANDNGYFVGNRQSLWWMVALGMLLFVVIALAGWLSSVAQGPGPAPATGAPSAPRRRHGRAGLRLRQARRHPGYPDLHG